MSRVLWECSAYSSTRASFMKKLQELLEDAYEDFESLENVEKSSYVLGSELWESKFDGLIALVMEYILDVWKIRKHKLYDSDSGSGLQLHTQSSPGERSGKFSQMVSLVRMVSLARMVSLTRMICLVRKVKYI